MTFAERLRHWRKFRKLTQEQLALACEFSGQSRIANYESDGESSRRPDLEDLPVIARALDIPVEALITDEAFRRVRDLATEGYPLKDTDRLTAREAKLVEDFRSAEEPGKAAIETTADALAKTLRAAR